MSYVPERITDYPQAIDDCPLHIDAEKLREAVEKYYEDPIGVKVASAIASFADSKGLAFPSVSRLSEMTGYTWQEVSKAVGRLQALGILTIQRRRFKNSQHSHNEYRFVKKFVRKVADIRSSHFLGNVLKWKAKAQDVAAAVKNHAVRAVSVVTDMAEKLAEPVKEKPAEPALSAPAPIQKPAEPVRDVSEEEQAAMFKVFDAHPELVNDPVQAARLAGVTLPDMKQSKPVSTPVQTVKRETSLETLPANTESVSAVGSANTETGPVQLDMTNCPKFINGEPDSRWVSQHLLNQLDPTMYPAY